jgi:N-acetylglucosaminyldiphosphoundecaprenol N-acetyl-beta-D-mannosaminyltransferase
MSGKRESTLSCAAARPERIVDHKRRTVHIGGVRFDATNRSQALESMIRFAAEGGSHLVCTPNIDHVVQCQVDPAFRETINRAALSVADGMGVVYASRLMGCPLPENVGGRLVLLDFCRVAAKSGYRIFLLGGEPGIAERAAKALTAMFPGLQIAGTFAPPLGFESGSNANEECVRAVRAAAPHALFVAFGAPKAEKWLGDNLAHLNVPVSMGVGYAFDLLAGKFPLPPSWMTAVGLEWAFRLWHDPLRLAKRYLWRDLRFFLILLAEIWRHRRGLALAADSETTG